MQPSAGAMDEYASAVASERAAWEAVRNRLPGTAGYSQELWKRWRACVDNADRAADRAKRALTQPQPADARIAGTRWVQAIRLPPIFSGRPKI